MNPQTILVQAEALGVKLSRSGNRIRYSPKSRTPTELVETLREHKEELLEYLSEHPDAVTDRDIELLLGWASELAESGLELNSPVTFFETALRPLTTTRVAYHARHYLCTIAHSRLQQKLGGWKPWTPQWWREREIEAIYALKALKSALDYRSKGSW